MRKKILIHLATALVVLTGSCQKGPSSESIDAGTTGKLAVLNVIAAAPPLGTLIDGAIYRIRGISSLPDGPVVEVTGNATAENAAIQQWSWFPNNGQKWKLVKTDATYYKLINLTSNKCLKSPSATSGDVLQQGTDDGSDAQ